MFVRSGAALDGTFMRTSRPAHPGARMKKRVSATPVRTFYSKSSF